MAAAKDLPEDILEKLAEFTPKQIQALQEVADQEASSWPSRRDVLKASAIAGGAGTAGAVMSNEGVQQVQAGASSNDGDGDIGKDTNRVDVFADGVDAVSVGADDATINSSLTYPREILRYTSPLGERNKGGGGSWFLADPVFSNGVVLHQQNITGSTIQVYSRVRDVSPGTASNPAVYEWDARLLNQQQYADQYIGLGERFVRTPETSIFILSNGRGTFTTAGELTFQTGDGSGNFDKTAVDPTTVDMTNVHTYRVEWTDEPRATLYIDGTQYAEHTTYVPTSDLIRFVEVVVDGTTAPASPCRIDIEADFLLPWLTA